MNAKFLIPVNAIATNRNETQEYEAKRTPTALNDI